MNPVAAGAGQGTRPGTATSRAGHAAWPRRHAARATAIIDRLAQHVARDHRPGKPAHQQRPRVDHALGLRNSMLATITLDRAATSCSTERPQLEQPVVGSAAAPHFEQGICRPRHPPAGFLPLWAQR